MKKDFLLFTMALLTLTAVQSQIVNRGNLFISSGTDVVMMNDYHNESTGTHTNEGDLHFKGNFINDGTVTSTTSGTTYFDSSTQGLQTLTGTGHQVYFNNLTINNTVAGNDGVSVADQFDLTVSNQLNMLSGKLRLMDEAMLIQTHTGVTTNTGTTHLLIDQDGAQNAYRYNYWSSPVHDNAGTYRVQNVLMDGTVPNQFHPTAVQYTNNYEGDITTSPITLSAYWFWKYIDGTINGYNEQDWQRLFDITTTPPTPSTTADINPAEGYIMKGPNASATYADRQNYTFEGIPNDGEYTVSLSANKEYLVGNPYPSALDADAFINDNISGTPVIDGTIYFWEHWSTDTHVYVEYGGGYATYNLSGGAAAATLHSHFTQGSGTGSIIPKRYIPVGQGFIIRSATTSGGTVTFKNSQRAFVREGANSAQFGPDDAYLNGNGVMQRIYLGYVNPTEGHRQVMLAFTDNVATPSYDYGYDGLIPELSDDDMYFTVDKNGEEMQCVIQGTGIFNEADMFPLSIKVTNPGLHTIMVDNTENFSHPMYIYDREMNTTTKIGGDLQFQTLLNPGTYNDRFYLVFRTIEQMQTDEIQDGLFEVSYQDGNIHLLNPENHKIDRVTVFDMLGKQVMSARPGSDASVIDIPFYFGESTYVILIKGDGMTRSMKFVNH